MSVYFVTCRQASAVKIGYSGDASIRIREIQTGCPMPVKLEAVLPGQIEDERALHARFADVRLCGEWFTITPMIEAIIAANPAPPPTPRANQYYRAPRFDTLVGKVRSQLRVTQLELAEMIGETPKIIRRHEHIRWAETPPDLEKKLRALIGGEQEIPA